MSDQFANWSARDRSPGDEAPLHETLREGSAPERRDAALGLVARADDDGIDDDAVAALESAAGEDPDGDVRQFAVEALGVAGRGGDAVDAALADADEWVRAEAVVALSRVRADAAADRLGEALADDSAWVRRNALVALGKLEAVEAGILHERLKTDPHPAVREYAAEYLATLPGDREETVTVLAAVLAREENAFVRARAATALGRLGTDRAIEALERQGTTDRSDDVQRAAERALSTARGEEARGDAATGEKPPAGREGGAPRGAGASVPDPQVRRPDVSTGGQCGPGDQCGPRPDDPRGREGPR